MRRIQLFEFEDYDWFPNTIRKNLTKLLITFNKLLKVDEIVANALKPILNNEKQIVDLGTGAGGIMPKVLENLDSDLKLILTDLYPNSESITEFRNHPKISYSDQSTNAEELNDAPNGIKTMINCFHHMPPNVAENILKSAQNNQQNLLIFELNNKSIPVLLWLLFLPIGLSFVFIMALILTPFTKSITWKQLVFTYIIPIIPLIFAWDGQASMPRTYSKEDLEEMIAKLPKSDLYKWTYTEGEKNSGKKFGYCFVGKYLG